MDIRLIRGLSIRSVTTATTQAPDFCCTRPEFHTPATPAFDPKWDEPSIASPLTAGLIGAVVLGGAGIVIGNALDDNHSDGSGGAAAGYLIGETVGVPLGVHLGNSRRGNYGGDLVVSMIGHLAALGVGALCSEMWVMCLASADRSC